MKWEQAKSGNGLTESIIVLDQHGIIRWASSSIHSLIGYLANEIVGKEIFSLVYKNPAKKIKELYGEIQKDPALLNEGLKQFIGKNGEKIPLFITLSNISGIPKMNGMLVHLRYFSQQENAANISLLLDEVEIEVELRRKIEREIAAELHDHICSGLVGIKLILEHALMDINRYNTDLQRLPPMMTDLIRDTRNLSHCITKKSVRNFELYETLNSIMEKFGKTDSIRIVLKYDKRVEGLLKNNQKVHLVRIVQEQVMNIINHSNASKALISIQCKDEKLIAVTRDNGKGFDPEKQHDGIGLANMYYRVNILGGNMHINSKCGEGSTFKITFPVN